MDLPPKRRRNMSAKAREAALFGADLEQLDRLRMYNAGMLLRAAAALTFIEAE